MAVKGNGVSLGDSLITEYRFKENYYFMGGDNLEENKGLIACSKSSLFLLT